VATRDRRVFVSSVHNEEQRSKARTPQKQESTRRRIAATDGQIDALAYELYGMREEELGIVEGG